MRWRSSRSSTGSVESLGPDEGGPAAGRVAERAVGGPIGQGASRVCRVPSRRHMIDLSHINVALIVE